MPDGKHPFRKRLVLAAVGALASAYIIASIYLVGEVSEARGLIDQTYRTGSWAAVQLEQEFDRLRVSGLRLQLDGSDENRDAFNLRYDIFWSRVNVLSTGVETQGVRDIPGVEATLLAVAEALRDLDRRLGPDDQGRMAAPGAPAAVEQTLTPFEGQIREIVRRSLMQDEFVYNRENLNRAGAQIALILGGLLALGLGLIAVALIQTSRSRRLVAEAEAARLQNQRLDLAVAGSNDGIALTDAMGYFTSMNEAHWRLFGFAGEHQAIGLHWGTLYSPTERDRIARQIMPVLARDGHWRGHATGMTLSSQPVEQEVSLSLMADGGILCITRDVTQVLADRRSLRLLEEQLLVAQKMEAIGRLASGFAHDFNNVLASINGYAELLHDETGETTTARRYAGQILTAAKRGRVLVDRILTFSRPTANGREACDLEATVDEWQGLLAGALPPGTRVLVEGKGARHTVGLSSDHLMQVLMNLGVNARDSIRHPPGTIRLTIADDLDTGDWPSARLGTAADRENLVRIRVEDDGTGMPEHHLLKVFEPFFTTKPVGKGTGLGLAAVSRIVCGAGGEIVMSSLEGKGTRCDLILPLARAEPEREATARPISPPAAWRVLIVEDDIQLREATAEALSRAGHHVETAADGGEALAMITARPDGFDAILTDEIMPVMRGSELIRELRQAGHALPVVLWSANLGRSAPELADLAADGGGIEFCRKPTAANDLLAAIGRSIAGLRA